MEFGLFNQYEDFFNIIIRVATLNSKIRRSPVSRQMLDIRVVHVAYLQRFQPSIQYKLFPHKILKICVYEEKKSNNS